MKLKILAIVVSLLALAAVLPAFADDDPATLDEVMEARKRYDRFQIGLGSYVTNFESEVSLSPSGGAAGTEINLEDLLGLSKQENVFRLDGYWRFNLKHRIAFGYYGVSRDASRTIDEEFNWGDEVVTVDSDVETNFDAPVFGASYQYAFVNNAKIESGVTVGLSVLDFSTGLTITDNIGGAAREAEAAAVIPLLVVGYYSSVTLKPKWFFEYSLSFFGGSYSGYSGSLVNAWIASSYYPVKNFGFGGAYSVYRIDVDVDTNDFDGSLDYYNRGFNLFLVFCFGKTD
jgi:hypothetical protein